MIILGERNNMSHETDIIRLSLLTCYTLYTRYPIVARALGLAAKRRVRRASKVQRYLAYNATRCLPFSLRANRGYSVCQ